MRPILLDIFGVRFGAYRTCMTVAFVLCTLLSVRMSQRRNDGTNLSPTAGIWAFFGALIGAKVFYILQYQSWRDLWQALLVWQGNLVFYGGLAGSVLAVAIALRLARSPLVRTFDTIAVYTPLGQAITRFGCFLNGCCYGVQTDVPWGVRFPRHSVAHTDQVMLDIIPPDADHSLTVHPSQLYMVTGLLLMFVTLRIVLKRKQSDGVVVCAYLGLYGVLRFLVEFVRGDNDAWLLGLTIYQWVSIALMTTAAAGLLLIRVRRRVPPAEQEA